MRGLRSQVLAVLLTITPIGSVTAGYFAGVSNKSTFASSSTLTISTTATQTVTRTAFSLVTTTATRSIQGTESQCGFNSTCSVFNSAGLGLTLSVNSTRISPNGTIALDVREFNPLPVTNNVSSSANLLVRDLGWGCNSRWIYPHGIAVFSGYYTLNNLTAAQALGIWPPIPCALPYISNGTSGTGGVFLNATSYSFMPGSYYASLQAYYIPVNTTGGQGSKTLGTFVPYSMMSEITISATKSDYPREIRISLGSAAPAVYTLVAGDEWGNLVLLHFRVS